MLLLLLLRPGGRGGCQTRPVCPAHWALGRGTRAGEGQPTGSPPAELPRRGWPAGSILSLYNLDDKNLLCTKPSAHTPPAPLPLFADALLPPLPSLTWHRAGVRPTSPRLIITHITSMTPMSSFVKWGQRQFLPHKWGSCETCADVRPVVFVDHTHVYRVSAPKHGGWAVARDVPLQCLFLPLLPSRRHRDPAPQNLGSPQGSHPSRHSPPNEELESGPGNHRRRPWGCPSVTRPRL